MNLRIFCAAVQQCSSVRECAAVCGSEAMCDNAGGCAAMCGSVRQCDSVWQYERRRVAVRAAVCGSARGSVRLSGSSVWQWAQMCAAVRG